MAGESAFKRTRCRRRSALLAALLSLLVAVAASATPLLGGRAASAAVLATDAADYVPTTANLPAGYREESTESVGGDVSPTIVLRRSFVTQDAGRRVDVSVALGSSEQDAQAAMTERVNQLARFEGWRMGPNEAFGEAGYRGSVVRPDGSSSAVLLFRERAVRAEVMVTSAGGSPDLVLLENLARLVAGRIAADPEATAHRAGWPEAPAKLPGKDPEPVAAVAVGPFGAVPPGAQATGSSSGSPIPGDTIVLLTVTGLERPWEAGGSLPPPSNGMEYLTAEVQIEVAGPTEVVIALSDFWVSTFDGRAWSPIPGRSPALLAGSVAVGGPTRGWLTFMLPRDQPALQLTWRLRTAQSLGSQGNVDQTIVVPLAVGATASAQVGTSAPPAGAPVVPPSSSPSGPAGPAGPSGPTAPAPAPSGPSGPGGGGSGRGGSRLQ